MHCREELHSAAPEPKVVMHRRHASQPSILSTAGQEDEDEDDDDEATTSGHLWLLYFVPSWRMAGLELSSLSPYFEQVKKSARRMRKRKKRMTTARRATSRLQEGRQELAVRFSLFSL